MKKVVCLLLILSVFASTSVSAADGAMISTGLTGIGTGIFFFALPSLVSADPNFNEPDFGSLALAYGAGTVFTVLGLVVVIAGAMRDDESYYAMIENPILNVVSFNIIGKKTFIGAKFSIK